MALACPTPTAAPTPSPSVRRTTASRCPRARVAWSRGAIHGSIVDHDDAIDPSWDRFDHIDDAGGLIACWDGHGDPNVTPHVITAWNTVMRLRFDPHLHSLSEWRAARAQSGHPRLEGHLRIVSTVLRALEYTDRVTVVVLEDVEPEKVVDLLDAHPVEVVRRPASPSAFELAGIFAEDEEAERFLAIDVGFGWKAQDLPLAVNRSRSGWTVYATFDLNDPVASSTRSNSVMRHP